MDCVDLEYYKKALHTMEHNLLEESETQICNRKTTTIRHFKEETLLQEVIYARWRQGTINAAIGEYKSYKLSVSGWIKKKHSHQWLHENIGAVEDGEKHPSDHGDQK